MSIFRMETTSYNALLAVHSGEETRAVGGRRFEGRSRSTQCEDKSLMLADAAARTRERRSPECIAAWHTSLQ
eukprot:6199587-Pleurochrysis_carterae.AAC.2